MARADNITSLFGKSPIAPLQKHMKQAHSCLKDFNAFAIAANAQDWDTADTIRTSINNKEEKADKLKKKLTYEFTQYFYDAFFASRFARCSS